MRAGFLNCFLSLAWSTQAPADCTCNCTREPSCKAGVNIIQDGCGCCSMCARQQGDICNAKDKCDEAKGLYCYHAGGADANSKGTCRGNSIQFNYYPFIF